MTILSDIPVHKIFPCNSQGRDLFVGDIHGQYALLIHALKVLHFDKYHDRIFSVGDLTDRGIDSLRCLKLAREKWFFPVLGNHESFILEKYDNDIYKQNVWIMNGGEWWFSLSREEKALARNIVSSCYSLTLSVTVGKLVIGLIHASYPFSVWPPDERNTSDESLHEMLWGRDDILKNTGHHINHTDLVICGHTPLVTPQLKQNKLFIDTGAAYNSSKFIPDPRLTLCELQAETILIHSINMHDEKHYHLPFS
ncbi:metallophosphoesterase [Vibrio sp. HA2012]|nr:metallophosphoesterase [Vibrio sp. HA2012]